MIFIGIKRNWLLKVKSCHYIKDTIKPDYNDLDRKTVIYNKLQNSLILSMKQRRT